MNRHPRLAIAVLAASVVSLAAVPAATANIFKGTVVHKNRRAHSFVVASPTGQLRAVHAGRAPRIGSVVRVRARRLRNGTFAAQSVRKLGTSRRARMRGTVTHVNHRRHQFTVSSRGASVLVHDASGNDPQQGQVVVTDVTTDDQGDIEANDVQQVGEDNGRMDLEGAVKAIDTNARTLTLSADDNDQSGDTVIVHVGPSFDLSKFQVGQEEELVVTKNADGTFELVGSSGDDNQDEADSQADDQGDNHGDGEHHQSGAVDRPGGHD